ncbi:hypothetical protein [Streptomyces sp. NPDC094466]|uniref:hypothetical protein n=1 Tax=Streptomyces sp. NPDC094466 TaxID=3366065 RepID=UPI0037FCDDB7
MSGRIPAAPLARLLDALGVGGGVGRPRAGGLVAEEERRLSDGRRVSCRTDAGSDG